MGSVTRFDEIIWYVRRRDASLGCVLVGDGLVASEGPLAARRLQGLRCMTWDQILANEAVHWSELIRAIFSKFDPVWTLLAVGGGLLTWRVLKVWEAKR